MESKNNNEIIMKLQSELEIMRDKNEKIKTINNNHQYNLESKNKELSICVTDLNGKRKANSVKTKTNEAASADDISKMKSEAITAKKHSDQAVAATKKESGKF